MVFPGALPYVESSLGSQGGLALRRGPELACSLSWARGRIIPTVRCVLVSSDQHVSRLSTLAPAAARTRPQLAGSSAAAFVARTKRLAVALADTHKAWSSQSMQTLQRVGSMIRSTSLECIAALGTVSVSAAAAASAKKKAAAVAAAAPAAAAAAGAAPERQPGPQLALASSSSSGGGGGGGDDEDEAGQVRAGLSPFLSTASQAEVTQAAMLSDLSNMAYDVDYVTAERLQSEHGLALVAHSRAAAAAAAAAQAPLLLQGGDSAVATPQLQDSPSHQAGQAQEAPFTPWPVPAALQAAGSAATERRSSSSSNGGGFSASLPASPRTPMVLASFAEGDDGLGAFEHQQLLATASAQLPGQGSPRRASSATAAAAATALTGAPVSPSSSGALPPPLQAAGGEAPLGELLHSLLVAQRSGSLQDFLPEPLHHQQQQQAQPQHDGQDHGLLQQLRQQESLLLLEMEANRQLLMMIQQHQAQDEAQEPLPDAAQHLRPVQHNLAAVAAAASVSIDGGDSGQLHAASAAGAAVLDVLEELGHQEQQQLGSAGAAADGSSSSSSASLAPQPPPADWFCADGPLSSADATPTRFFVIQGSISLEHWRINLTIDPCEFEGGALGPIKVHRGVYEAALAMYEPLLVHVRAHLAAHPGGKVAFTGHSLGGSLATLLMLLYVHRGELSPASVATVRTFGSPAIFCEGATGSAPTAGACSACSLPCEHRRAHLAATRAAAAAAAPAAAASPAASGLLSKLGLPGDAVVNVVMTRDIVPRAFVCDYTLVAGVLRSWMPSFKEHNGLAACKQHKALYNFVGTVEVLQPTHDCDFVQPGEGHAMLPPVAALYRLTEPHQQQQQQQPAATPSAAAEARGAKAVLGSFDSLASLAGLGGSGSPLLDDLTSSFTAFGSDGSSAGGSLGMAAVPVSAAEAAAAAVGVASSSSTTTTPSAGLTLGDAILTFMNSPHPLQTLGEVRAYGPNGTISRYHNPTSYTKALQALCRQQQQQ